MNEPMDPADIKRENRSKLMEALVWLLAPFLEEAQDGSEED